MITRLELKGLDVEIIINENDHIFLTDNNKEIKKVEYGFIILRYVVDKKTNNFWITCYNSIRKFYDNKIVIIDDHSNKKFLTPSLLYMSIILFKIGMPLTFTKGFKTFNFFSLYLVPLPPQKITL